MIYLFIFLVFPLNIISESDDIVQTSIVNLESYSKDKLSYCKERAKKEDLSEMSMIRNLHWWTVEYGLVGTLKNPKIYGAGLLSSFGELEYSCAPYRPAGGTDDRPEIRPWIPEQAAMQEYPITTYQPIYYCAESMEDAKDKMYDKNCIVKLIKKLVKNKHYNFLETLAEDVFDELFKDKRIDKITLQIEKLEIMKDCSSVGIQISKKRSHDQL